MAQQPRGTNHSLDDRNRCKVVQSRARRPQRRDASGPTGGVQRKMMNGPRLAAPSLWSTGRPTDRPAAEAKEGEGSPAHLIDILQVEEDGPDGRLRCAAVLALKESCRRAEAVPRRTGRHAAHTDTLKHTDRQTRAAAKENGKTNITLLIQVL